MCDITKPSWLEPCPMLDLKCSIKSDMSCRPWYHKQLAVIILCIMYHSTNYICIMDVHASYVYVNTNSLFRI